MTDDLKLKLLLAKELPELIDFDDRTEWGFGLVPVWKDENYREVTDREWDWVVNQCIKSLKYSGNVEFGGGPPKEVLLGTYATKK